MPPGDAGERGAVADTTRTGGDKAVARAWLAPRLFIAALAGGVLAALPADPAIAIAASCRPDQPEAARAPAESPYSAAWQRRLDLKIEEIRAHRPQVVFVGDSLTQRLERPENASAWATIAGGFRAVNFGFGGDMTANALWRIQRITPDATTPRLFVVMIGINDLLRGRRSPEGTADGIRTIVTEIGRRWPEARILLLGILPIDDRKAPGLHEKIIRTNALLAACPDGRRVLFRDYGPLLAGEAGRPRQADMVDPVHPGPAGYGRYADALARDVAAAMDAAR